MANPRDEWYRQFGEYNPTTRTWSSNNPYPQHDYGFEGPGQGQPDPDETLISNGLSWFSLGLGLVQFLAPGWFAEQVGLEDSTANRTLLRMVGLREIGVGVGLRTERRPTGWVQARMLGDVMDLAVLGKMLAAGTRNRNRTLIATLAVVAITVIDFLAARRLANKPPLNLLRTAYKGEIFVRKSITVNMPVELVYGFWHNFENLPRFMNHLESVEVMDSVRSHWKAKAPVGLTVEWDAVMTTDRPNDMIAWQSTDGADIENSGSVQFRPAPNNVGTELTVELRYKPPAGKLGAAIAKLFGEEPEIQIADDLRAFKQVLETGEVVRSDSTELGNRLSHRPAQPRTEASVEEAKGLIE